jgi:plastocyanin
MTRARTRALIALALAAGVLMAASSPSLGTHYPPIKPQLRSGIWKWDPTIRHIGAPHRIKWKNPDRASSVNHTVKFWTGPLKGDRKVLRVGDVVTFRIPARGIHRYRCDLPGHSTLSQQDGRRVCSGMCGVVRAH